jgi:hypothetical protein
MKERLRGISPVIAGLLIIVLAAGVMLLVFIFASGLLGGLSATESGVRETIVPSIYSSEAGIGVLNQNANFTVTVYNSLSSAQEITIDVSEPSGHLLQSVSSTIPAGATRTIQVAQRLNATGLWTVRVTFVITGVKIGSYTFDVKPNRDEADFAVQEWRDQRFYRLLIFVAIGLAVISIAIAVAAVARPRIITLTPKGTIIQAHGTIL